MLNKSKKLWKRTCDVIPCGVQTLSKMPSKNVGGICPIYIENACGCHVYTRTGKRYIDYPCALGTVTLGYNYPEVNEAVENQLCKGVLYSLPSYEETKLAELLVQVIPSAEQVRFLKTGSEAVLAALRIARSYTGRDHVAYSGYHGWMDWYVVNTSKNKGILKSLQKTAHSFSNLHGLERILKKHKVAAVIMEPYVFEERPPHFLKKVKELTRKYGALLIFDEIVTGFRTLKLSAQAWFEVTPDLSTFGKGMGNGFAISCVVGKKEYMKELEGDCFVSSTFGGDLVGIAAAMATIKVMKKNKVMKHMWDMGSILQDSFNDAAYELDIKASCKGYPTRTFFHFPTEEHKSLFWQECLLRGVFFGYAQFTSYSHLRPHMEETTGVIHEAMKVVKTYWKNPKEGLKGKSATQVFRLIRRDK